MPIAVSKQGATIESSGGKAGLVRSSSPGSVLIHQQYPICTLRAASFPDDKRLLIDDPDSGFQAV